MINGKISMHVIESFIEIFQSFIHNGVKLTLDLGFNIVLIKQGDIWHSNNICMEMYKIVLRKWNSSTQGKYTHKCLMDVLRNMNDMVITVMLLVLRVWGA